MRAGRSELVACERIGISCAAILQLEMAVGFELWIGLFFVLAVVTSVAGQGKQKI